MSDPDNYPDFGQDARVDAPQWTDAVPDDNVTQANNNNHVGDEQQLVASKPKPKRAPSKPKPLFNPNPSAPGDVRFPAELPENLVRMFHEWMVANETNVIPLDTYFMQSPWVFKIHDANSTKNATDAAYFHATTGQKLDVRIFTLRWMVDEPVGRNSQRLLVAYSPLFGQPVILCRMKKGSNEFRIWRGVKDNRSEQPSIMKKAIGPKKPGTKGPQRTSTELAGPAPGPRLNPSAISNFMMPDVGYSTNAVHAGAMQTLAAPGAAVINAGMPDVSMMPVGMTTAIAFNPAMSPALATTSAVSSATEGYAVDPNIMGRNTEGMIGVAADDLHYPASSSNDSSSTGKRKRSTSSVSSHYLELAANIEEEQVDEEVLGNALASIRSPDVQPAAVFAPPRGPITLRDLAFKVFFRFYASSQNHVRVRSLFQCDSFPSFVTHAVAGGLISEYDQFKILLCEWSVMNGVPKQKMVVDEQDWQELLQMLSAEVGWAVPQAVCNVHVTKKLW